MRDPNTDPPPPPITTTWNQHFSTLLDHHTADDESDRSTAMSWGEAAMGARDTIGEFAKGAGEMCVVLARSFVEVVKESAGDKETSIGRGVGRVCGRLGFLNEYLPEEKDPVMAWGVIVSVFVVAVLALMTNSAPNAPIDTLKKVQVHPPNASHILLPDGRHMAYHEQGVPADLARFTIIAPHSFLHSRLAGIPGIKASLMDEFGVRLITYDLPGFGESDPHALRSLESSAMDMPHLADALGVNQKFWVVGHSDGTFHAWAALRYIPDKLAGVAVFAPMVNPYDPSMTKEERSRTWKNWSQRRKLMYILARRFPRFLSYYYHRTFFSGQHGSVDKWLSLRLGKRDKTFIEDPRFETFWQRNVEESIRQGSVKAFVEEVVLQVSIWDFNIADLQSRKVREQKGFLLWLKSLYSPVEEELMGFLGPIHIWQGMEDGVVSPALISYLQRVLPGASVHMLPNEGHFTYFYFCDECHRQIFATIFGTPEGPLHDNVFLEQAAIGANTLHDQENMTSEDLPTQQDHPKSL
ncbi:hypothetical protein AKJ16_DCAP22684 [Drosera capensis]